MITNVESVFTVTDFKENKRFELVVTGAGQEVMKLVRKSCSRFSKIVLEGFNLNGNFVALNFRKS